MYGFNMVEFYFKTLIRDTWYLLFWINDWWWKYFSNLILVEMFLLIFFFFIDLFYLMKLLMPTLTLK